MNCLICMYVVGFVIVCCVYLICKHCCMLTLYFSGGGYAEYAAVEEGLVMPIPESCKFSDAASIPENWLTAYQLLHFLGNVQSGEVVLIHAGGSGVGAALIQLSHLAGAKPFVTAGTDEKIKKAKSLGARGGFNYKTGDFSDWVESITEGINCVVWATK